MRPSVFLSVIALSAAAACSAETGPRCPIDGDWSWVGNNNPGGLSLYISLTSSGRALSGVGSATGVGPSSTTDSIAVSGQYVQGILTNVSLTLSYRSGRVVSYAAFLVCPDYLSGTAVEGGNSRPLAFSRQ